jgi:hypothetical protein
MYAAVDNFVRGVIVYLAAILRAAGVGVVGILTFRSFRSALRLRTLAVSDPDFTVSGRAMLVLACLTVALVQREATFIEPEKSALEFVREASKITNMLVACLTTSLALDLLVLLLIFGPQNRRMRPKRRLFSRRQAVQRAEILRYMIASAILLLALLSLAGAVWMTAETATSIRISLPGIAIAFVIVGVSGSIALASCYPSLAQLDLPKTPWKRVLVRVLSGPSICAVIAMVFALAVQIQGHVVSAIFPAARQFPVSDAVVDCIVMPDGAVTIAALAINTGEDRLYLSPKDAVVILSRKSKFVAGPSDDIKAWPLAFEGDTPGLAILGPKESLVLHFRLSATDIQRVRDFTAKGPAYCGLAAHWTKNPLGQTRALLRTGGARPPGY